MGQHVRRSPDDFTVKNLSQSVAGYFDARFYAGGKLTG
jgi:hypothetical protein